MRGVELRIVDNRNCWDDFRVGGAVGAGLRAQQNSPQAAQQPPPATTSNVQPGPAAQAPAQTYTPVEGDFVIRDFQFKSGETLPELRMHYRTLGTPTRDANGRVTNAVLILHGTGGWGGNFLAPQFAGVLYGSSELLDITRYYIILPDNIGHGKSSKPSDGMHAHFPQYEYDDMVLAQHELVTEGPERQPSAPDHGHVHGLHAFLDMGRNVSRFHGCADAAGLPAGANCKQS